MPRWAASALVVALVLWISSPALACLAQPEKMTEAEMQCCREMAGQCGEMAKAEHSCCPKTPAKVETAKRLVLSASEKTLISVPSLVGQATTLPLHVPQVERIAVDRVQSSESPPGALTPLRI
jgi:hypothetical protein